jgi:hypothetical protein
MHSIEGEGHSFSAGVFTIEAGWKLLICTYVLCLMAFWNLNTSWCIQERGTQPCDKAKMTVTGHDFSLLGQLRLKRSFVSGKLSFAGP